MSLGPRKTGLALAVVAVAIIAFFSVGALNSEQAAGSYNPAPKANILAASLTLSDAHSRGGGPSGVHQITGSLGSLFSIAGLLLGSPHTTYPIDFDCSGNFVATAVVPVTLATLSAGTVTVSVTDDRGCHRHGDAYDSIAYSHLGPRYQPPWQHRNCHRYGISDQQHDTHQKFFP